MSMSTIKTDNKGKNLRFFHRYIICFYRNENKQRTEIQNGTRLHIFSIRMDLGHLAQFIHIIYHPGYFQFKSPETF